MTAPATRAVALAPTAPGQITSASEMNDALKAVQAAIAPDLNPAELKLFAMVAYRSGLDPFARQIHAVKRQGKVTFQTGIDGFRSTAERTGEYDGQDEPEYGPACSCSEAPKPHPEWARVTVYRARAGQSRLAQSATAYWHEYKPAPGQSGNGDAMYKKMPRLMLAKCAEALAFRKAFPYVLADIYSPEEMAQADAGPVVVEHRPTARQAVAERRAAIEADPEATQEVSQGEFTVIEEEGGWPAGSTSAPSPNTATPAAPQAGARTRSTAGTAGRTGASSRSGGGGSANVVSTPQATPGSDSPTASPQPSTASSWNGSSDDPSDEASPSTTRTPTSSTTGPRTSSSGSGPSRTGSGRSTSAAPTAGSPTSAESAPGAGADPAQLPESTDEADGSGQASAAADVVEGEVVAPDVVEGEVVAPAELTKDELLAELTRLEVSPDYAITFARQRFDLPANTTLTGAQRAELVTALEAEKTAAAL